MAGPFQGGSSLSDINTSLQNLIRTLAQVSANLTTLNTSMTEVFPAASATATTATAGTRTLPGNPVGFLVVTLPGGGVGKVPYYGE